MKLVDLKRQEASILAEIQNAVSQTVERRDFILGKALNDFEKHLAAYLGVRHTMGTGSGGTALTIALKTLNVKEGDEIITQPNSHASTAFAAVYLGARPVFVDVNPETFQMDPQKLESAITPRTKAILPVHIYGYSAPMKEILEIAERRNIPVVEDTAHAIGASYQGRRCGSLGIISCFSFYPGKNLGCWGDGGAVATNDDAMAESVRLLRTYGDGRKNYHTELGINSRLDTIQAAILDVKLKMLDEWNRQRREAAAWYLQWFRELKVPSYVLLPPLELQDQTSIFHVFVIRVPEESRDSIYEYMNTKDIECGIHYPLPIHLQPVLSGLGYSRGDFPVSENLARTVLSLPMYAGITEEECRRVVETVRDFFESRNSIS